MVKSRSRPLRNQVPKPPPLSFGGNPVLRAINVLIGLKVSAGIGLQRETTSIASVARAVAKFLLLLPGAYGEWMTRGDERRKVRYQSSSARP